MANCTPKIERLLAGPFARTEQEHCAVWDSWNAKHHRRDYLSLPQFLRFVLA